MAIPTINVVDRTSEVPIVDFDFTYRRRLDWVKLGDTSVVYIPAVYAVACYADRLYENWLTTYRDCRKQHNLCETTNAPTTTDSLSPNGKQAVK